MDGQAPPDGQAPRQGGFNITEIACNILGLTQDEFMEKMQEGTSLADIASEQGLSEEEFENALLAAMTEEVQQQVSDGEITQEQADEMLERMQEMIESGMYQGPMNGLGGGPPGEPTQEEN
jgi:hypothetical protein